MSATSGESRYQRLRSLGRGGTAEVSAVYVTDRRTTAALKVPLPDSTDSHQVFPHLAAREARLIGRERFPGLVRLLEPPVDPATSLLLELCPGPTLDRVGRIDNMPLLLNILSSLAIDLAFLDARGIVHADIKPQNFFLPSHWQSCTGTSLFHCKLSDFSLGRFTNEPESSRAGAGTVGYMAPETILSNETSHQSDLFAFGAIAYQLTTGSHPFLSEDAEPVRVNARVAEENPQPVRDSRPEIPEALAELISSLLAKRAADRPRSAFAVCRTLETIGAQYPYRTALRPTHFIAAAETYVEALEASVDDDLKKSSHLASITDGNKNALRLLLSANLRRGSLRFEGQRFTAVGNLVWPSLLRRNALRGFSGLALSGKRQAIIQSVVADRELGQTPARLDLILHMLKQRTARRIARRHAPMVERSGNPAQAARLFVMAGDLANAERCACNASVELKSDHKPDQALRVLESVLSYAELLDERFAARQALMHQGDILKEIGEADKALAAYQQMIELYANHSPDKLLAETYKDLGDLFKMKQDFRSGIAALEKALAIYQRLDDEIEISHTLNNLGNIYCIKSEFGEALSHYRAGLRIQRRRDLKPEIASTINNIATIYAIRSRLARSIRLLGLSLNLNRELGQSGEMARTLNNLGYVYVISGQRGLAVESLQESAAINRRIGSRKELLFNLENLSEVTLQLGRVKEAIGQLNEGLTLSGELGDKRHLASLHINLANAHLRLGQAARAQQLLATARSYIDQIDDRQHEILHLIHSSRVRRFIGDRETALAMARRAAEIANELGDRHSRLQALLEITNLIDDAELVTEADATARSLGLPREQLLLTYNRIERLLELQEVSSAWSLFDDSRKNLSELGEDIEWPHLAGLAAELLFESGELEDAARWLGKALLSAQAMGLAPEIAGLLTTRARIENAHKAHEQVYATSRQALQVTRQLAENIDNDSDRAVFLNRRSVTDLIQEVRRLGAALGQKQRAE